MTADATADAILHATLTVLGQRGVKGATTRLIAERAGVNEVTLFRKFGSKKALIKAAVETQFDTVQHQAVHLTGDVVADLCDLAAVYHTALTANGPAARVVLTEFANDPELADVVASARDLFAAIAHMLQHYQASGELAQEPVDALVMAFIGPIAIPIVLPWTRPGLKEFDPPAHVDRFLHGHAGRVAR